MPCVSPECLRWQVIEGGDDNGPWAAGSLKYLPTRSGVASSFFLTYKICFPSFLFGRVERSVRFVDGGSQMAICSKEATVIHIAVISSFSQTFLHYS